MSLVAKRQPAGCCARLSLEKVLSCAEFLTPLLQALALAAASTRLEADAESTSRVKEAEKRLLARIQSK
jgi:hypothetical protein